MFSFWTWPRKAETKEINRYNWTRQVKLGLLIPQNTYEIGLRLHKIIIENNNIPIASKLKMLQVHVTFTIIICDELFANFFFSRLLFVFVCLFFTMYNAIK